jgi:MFS family permease
VSRVATRVRESLTGMRAALTNPDLRRLQLAYLGSSIGQWAGSVAITVYAFRAAGAAGVGLQLVLRMLPAAIAAPFTSTLADRYARERVMVVSDLIRVAVAAGMAALVLAGADYLIVFAASGLSGVVATAFQPAKAALLPRLAREPDELTAANVVSSSIDSVSLFVGPALGGLLLAATSVQTVLLATAAALGWSALLVSRIRAPRAATRPDDQELASVRGFLRDVVEGGRAVAHGREPRLLVGLIAAQTLVDGALTVLLVAAALDLLDMGPSGLGLLNSAAGIGGILGAVFAVSLVGRRRLSPVMALGLALWGVPIAVVGLLPAPGVALAMLAVVGVGNTLVDVAGYTLLQRAVPDEVLGRVFGILETMVLGSIALGGALAAVLVDAAGIEAALVVTGAFLPAVLALGWRGLSAIDARAAGLVSPAELALLRGVPIFAPLPPPALEELAARLRPIAAPAGSAIVEQGEAGDRFYVIASGEADVLVDGRVIRRQETGDWFGEIALLRDAPRTASVRARTDLELRALDRDEFLAAVTGHAPSARAADAAVSARLAWARPALAGV